MALSLEQKYYLATFTYKIPVKVTKEKTVEGEKIEAFYKAQDIYFDRYTLTDADIEIKPISQDEYETKQETASKLHKYN